MWHARGLLAVLWALVFAYLRLASGRDLPDAPASTVFAQLRSRVHDTYFSNDELDAFVLGMAAACPDIMSVFEWGRSEAGTRLLAVDISTTAGERCGLIGWATAHGPGCLHTSFGCPPSAHSLNDSEGALNDYCQPCIVTTPSDSLVVRNAVCLWACSAFAVGMRML